ncbi:nuclear transport factor 2 family protein [Streptomyces sp. NPDC055722]
MTDVTDAERAGAHAIRTVETRDLVERFVKAWFAADADELVSLLAEDASWRPPASVAGPIEGRDRIAAGLAGGAAGKYVRLETLVRSVNAMVVDGDRAAVMVHLQAETLAGGEYVNEYTWVFECSDGVVARVLEYADTLHAARLGFVPFRTEDGDSGDQ